MTGVTSLDAQSALLYPFSYVGRRVSKKVWSNAEGTGSPDVDLRFAYDNWDLIAVLGPDFSPIISFTWGTDLSGTMQGAGGVGGLLGVTMHTGPSAGTYFCCYDGNGNVTALVSASDASVAARYEYGPLPWGKSMPEEADKSGKLEVGIPIVSRFRKNTALPGTKWRLCDEPCVCGGLNGVTPLQGFAGSMTSFPRALPWAFAFCPVGANSGGPTKSGSAIFSERQHRSWKLTA